MNGCEHDSENQDVAVLQCSSPPTSIVGITCSSAGRTARRARRRRRLAAVGLSFVELTGCHARRVARCIDAHIGVKASRLKPPRCLRLPARVKEPLGRQAPRSPSSPHGACRQSLRRSGSITRAWPRNAGASVRSAVRLRPSPFGEFSGAQMRDSNDRSGRGASPERKRRRAWAYANRRPNSPPHVMGVEGIREATVRPGRRSP